jgi:hypothetical protein
MKTDFSGEYVLDRAATALGAGADADEGGIVQIDHRR